MLRVPEILAISMIWIAVKAAMVCDKSAAAQLFKVPENLECEEGHEKSILVKLEKTNIKQYKVKATRLIVSEKKCQVSQQFFGAREVKRTEKRLLWTKDEYLKHLSAKRCATITGEVTTRSGSVEPKCETKWMKTTVNTEIQCLYQEGQERFKENFNFDFKFDFLDLEVSRYLDPQFFICFEM